LIYYDEIKSSKFIRIFRNDEPLGGQPILTSKDLTPEIYKSSDYDLFLEIRLDFFNAVMVNYTAAINDLANKGIDSALNAINDGSDDLEQIEIGYFKMLREKISKRKKSNFKYLLKPNEVIALLRFVHFGLVLNSTSLVKILFGISLNQSIAFLLYFQSFQEGWQPPIRKVSIQDIIKDLPEFDLFISVVLTKVCEKVFNIRANETLINFFNIEVNDSEIIPGSGLMGKTFGSIGETLIDCFETDIFDFLGSFYFCGSDTQQEMNKLLKRDDNPSIDDFVELFLNKYYSMEHPLKNFYQIERFRI